MANPVFIQGNTTTGGSGQTTATCAYTSNVTAGSMLYCTVRFSPSGGSGTAVITATDNNGNTWTPTTTTFAPSDRFRSFYVIGANAGATTVTINITGGFTGFIRCAISESGPGITGVDTTGIWNYSVNSQAQQYADGLNTSKSNVYVIMSGGQNTTSTTPSSVGGGFAQREVNAAGDALICDMFSPLPLASTGAGNVTWGTSCKCALFMMSFTTTASATANLWTRKGQVILPTFADFNNTIAAGAEAPNVIYEGNPQILTGQSQVFKMWFMGGVNFNYAESIDGINWTRYSSNLLTNALYFPRVTKVGSTYYASGPRAGTFPWTAIDIYSSTDGIHWTIYQSGTITLDSTFNSFTHGLLWVEGGTWYLIYDELNAGAEVYQIGVATSTNLGATWAKQGIILTTNNPSGPFMQKIGSTYYLWAETWLYGNGGLAGASDIYRWHSSSITSGWVMDGCTFQRIETDEGPDTIGTNGEVSDICMVQVGDETYMYYVNVPTQAAITLLNSYIKLAVTQNPISSVVTSPEGTVTDVIATPLSTSQYYVQSASAFSSSPSGPNSPGLAFTSNNQAGNFLLLLARATDGVNASIKLTGVTDTAGNTWQFGFAFAEPGNYVNGNFDTVLCYFVPSCKASANTVTINTTDASPIFWNVALVEYTGLGSAPTVLNACYAAAQSAVEGSNGILGNLHAKQGGVMAALFGNPSTNGLTFTPGSGWTTRQSMNGNTFVADGLASAAGVFQAAGGFSSSIPWEGGVALLGTLAQTPVSTGMIIQGNAGIAGALITYTGPTSGTAVADGNGLYTINNAQAGTYTITPSLAGYTFTPASHTVVFGATNSLNNNFTAAGASTPWSEVDSRNYSIFPNSTVDIEGTQFYTVETDSRTAGAPQDCRTAGQPVDSRVNKPTNCRTAPPFED